MKTIGFLFLAGLLFSSCDKNKESNATISQDDLSASVPGHQNESLVNTPNNHQHINSDQYHTAHDLNHHHALESLYHVHNLLHP